MISQPLDFISHESVKYYASRNLSRVSFLDYHLETTPPKDLLNGYMNETLKDDKICIQFYATFELSTHPYNVKDVIKFDEDASFEDLECKVCVRLSHIVVGQAVHEYKKFVVITMKKLNATCK